LMEAALYSIPVSFIERLVEQGNRTGIILKKLRKKIDQPITAILTLNTISHTAGAAFAGAMATKVFGSQWIGIFSGIFTLAILFFSEVIPKTAGVVYARSLARWIARPLVVLVWLFKPLIWLLSLATRLVGREQRIEQFLEEELVVMAKLGRRRGVIDENELTVIENVLSLENKSVRDIMTPRTVLFSLRGDMTVDDARIANGFFNHSRIPLYFENAEDIKGFAHRRDILNAVAEDNIDLKLESIMRPVHYVQEKSRLNKVLKMFLERKEHLFIVIDEFGGLAGIITLEDLIEEILGKEIIDEFDKVVDMRELAQKKGKQVFNKSDNDIPEDDKDIID